MSTKKILGKDNKKTTNGEQTAVTRESKKSMKKNKAAKDNNSKVTNGKCPEAPKIAKTPYKYNWHLKEDQGQPILGVQFNYYITNKPTLFATVSKARVTIYECPVNETGIKLLQCYSDPDPDENFYTCSWSYVPDSDDPILAAAGYRGIIRIFNLEKQACTKHFIGHGQAINEIKFHTKLPQILLSASKDHSLRLWNIQTDVCIAIFGGVDGHRDEVLSIDFDLESNRIISSGIDHSLKLWHLDKPPIKEAIKNSFFFNASKNVTSFPTIREYFPAFSTRDIHGNYVDCVFWFNEFILSKSCENSIVCWQPNIKYKHGKTKSQKSSTVILHHFDYSDCTLWFIRFAFNIYHKVLALGNEKGKTFVWQFNMTDPNLSTFDTLSHPKCTTTIRQASFSRDCSVLICVCDDGTIWRWDRTI